MMDIKYFEEIPAAVTVCDEDGKILYMNERSAATFAKDGGKSLIGRRVPRLDRILVCDPGRHSAFCERVTMIIYHITSNSEWQSARSSGTYLPQGYTQDGFIHCSKGAQVIRTANRFYTGQKELVLLKIESDLLPSKVVEENLEGGSELFPHIYGPLPVTAVVAASPLKSAEEGFIFPDVLK
jgi:uncharacterized protein (DUF952 family)